MCTPLTGHLNSGVIGHPKHSNFQRGVTCRHSSNGLTHVRRPEVVRKALAVVATAAQATDRRPFVDSQRMGDGTAVPSEEAARRKGPKVVVIGGGLAGLTAVIEAHRLMSRGKPAVVWEPTSTYCINLCSVANRCTETEQGLSFASPSHE